MFLLHLEMDGFIALTTEAPLLKNSEEYERKTNAWTKIKKKEDTQMQQTLLVLHEVENKRAQCKKQI